ncbi:MAG: helix-turn-helix transcriptional regulator [Clostridia bacterium]|nr:helix-turn-helix transcriptional regulator [Clostridia bacterium]
MEKEAAVLFFTHLIRNFQINVYRFRLPDFPEADMGLRRTLGIALRPESIPLLREIAPETIYVVQDMFLWRYTLLRLPQSEELMLVGPYIDEAVSDETIMRLMEKLRIPPARFADLQRFYHSVRVMSSDMHVLPVLNTLGATLWGEGRFSVESHFFQSETDVVLEDILSDPPAEEGQKIALIEKRYEIEKKLLYAIEHGQANQANAILSLIDPLQIDRRSPNPLRNMKNYVIISNTLMRKAVQQGGVHPFYIDQLSSTLGRRIEEATSIRELKQLMGSMAHKYCLLVKNHNMKGFSPPVQRVILRTDAEITGDLSLRAHASQLGINASYLSALFKKETGVTLTQYVNKRRVDYAIFLLNSTDMQVQTIAQHCGMPDVNHFIRTFKEHTGKTPTQYRRSVFAHP